MKKIIGTLGVAVFALAMFINSNSINGLSNMNLATLLGISDANAESGCLYGQKWCDAVGTFICAEDECESDESCEPGGTPINPNNGECDTLNDMCWGVPYQNPYYTGTPNCNVYLSGGI